MQLITLQTLKNTDKPISQCSQAVEHLVLTKSPACLVAIFIFFSSLHQINTSHPLLKNTSPVSSPPLSADKYYYFYTITGKTVV